MNKQLINELIKKFPNSNIQGAVDKANETLNGANGKAPNEILKSVGIDENGINNLFNKYGNSMQSKMILGMLGTSPEQLKGQALNLLNGGNNEPPKGNTGSSSKSKFPRLK